MTLDNLSQFQSCLNRDPKHVCFNHGPGTPCAVVDLAVSAYGEELGMHFLWEETCFPFDDDVAMAQLQEILRAKDGHLVGHTYLSGAALQLNRYYDFPQAARPADEAEWFSPAVARFVEIPQPDPEVFATPQAFHETLIKVVLDAKYGGTDAAVVSFHAGNEADMEGAGRALATAWSYTPADDSTLSTHTHLLGEVVGGKKTSLVHFQPKEHASDWAATPFQVGLLLSSLGRASLKAR